MTALITLLLAAATLHPLPTPQLPNSPTLHRATEPGVSETLAAYRAAHISDVSYTLAFDVPAKQEQPVTGSLTIDFKWDGDQDLQMDFQGTLAEGSCQVNGVATTATCADEHIVIPRHHLRQGSNTVTLRFTSTDKALNRNADYLYTLFVPDHARSAFPCFDQPDLKARFLLTLTVPDDWTAASNGRLLNADSDGQSKTVTFAKSDLLPTYLFSFVAGHFQQQTALRDGREISVLYRETDPAKVAQLPIVFDQIALSLRWLEAYTGISYPFQTYGCVVLPGYQFGGMEHPGCIQFRDKTIFLGHHPTADDELKRLQLIAHETAHMWFGDLVTMRWFNDVWTKEVFANFMADKICREQFPLLDHDLNFLKTHYIPAVATDRTDGTHPIQQQLGNLKDAGLLYGNIIYHKAPIMMRKLEERMGEEALRRGLQAYLRQFSYANATWDDLIALLHDVSPEARITDFDRQWVKQQGMEIVDASVDDGLPLPNADGRGYARYRLADSRACRHYADRWDELPTAESRLAALMTLYENFVMRRLPAAELADLLVPFIESERHEQLLPVACSYATNALRHIQPTADGGKRGALEAQLWTLARRHPSAVVRQQLMRTLGQFAVSAAVVDSVYQVWADEGDTLLSTNDYMSMSYHLAIARPAQWQQILSTQHQRLTSADQQREFDFVSRGCTPDTLQQAELFHALLLSVSGSGVAVPEPYALSLLSLLCDASRVPYIYKYILPALEAIEPIQQCNGIFFPLDWMSTLLSNHHTPTAKHLVEQFLDEHPSLPPALRGKLLQASFLLRTNPD